ncbi:hypothetical protein CKAN_02743500 [Cinnamomum micranthum f. kanehirae]|uniref:Uncharacterized protein n=1 Tax=Cinnamomum micranthum f. kanehirae TaxID=337451 RepID=A0A443Q4M9_9MAGN|nr:hypothetical protein CKAN_02743500 [Cinnamomum micranthum f. kanehirae]
MLFHDIGKMAAATKGYFNDGKSRKLERVAFGSESSLDQPLILTLGSGRRNEWIRRGAGLYFRAGREVKARREDRPPGKEEGKKVLSSISTSFSRRWKSRPAQRITGVVSPLRFANKEVILDDFPFLPCRAASLRHSKYYLCLPFL